MSSSLSAFTLSLKKTASFLLLPIAMLSFNFSAQAQAGPQTIEALILFDSGSDQPTAQSWEAAQEQVAGLDKYIRIRLTGYTDSVGSDDQNLVLSEKRAMAVKQLLVSLGFDGENITISAKGETEPAADNATAAGRAQNRRVVLSIR